MLSEQKTCDGCGKSGAAGWALYCVACFELAFRADARSVLSELVTLKAIHDEWEANELNGFAFKSQDNHHLHKAQYLDYERRSALAWAAAKRALQLPNGKTHE